jgi:predicted dehydrogenase
VQSVVNRVARAYVGVPSLQYVGIVLHLLRPGIHILKEKPAATNHGELETYHSTAKSTNVQLLTASQFRYGKFMKPLLASIHLTGNIDSIQVTRRFGIEDLASGWRA